MLLPKHSAYFWARFYIKIVRFLAFLSLIVGAIWFGADLWKGRLAYRLTVYTPNPSIGIDLEKVMFQYTTVSEILGARGIPAGGNSANTLSRIGRTPLRTSQLYVVQNVLNEISNDIRTMQNRYFDSFSRPIDSLVEILSQHSRQIRSKITPTNNTPSSSGDENEQSALPSRSPESKRMYGEVSMNEIRQLSSVKDELGSFLSQTTKDTTRACMTEAIKALEMYAEVMGAELPDPSATPNGRKIAEPKAEPTPRVELRVDDLIRSLKQHKALVHSVVLTDWQIDKLIEDLLKLVHEEIKKSKDCATAGKLQIVETGKSLVKVILLSLVVAFLVMVIADFLQAIIDTPDLIRNSEGTKE